MLIFESRMHFFQYKVLLRVLLNSLMIFMSVQLNPLYMGVLIRIVTAPWLNRQERKMKNEIEKALDSDYKIEYYAPKKNRKGDGAD